MSTVYTQVHVKRAVCGCGHAFASKRKAQCTTNESVKRKRASESEKETRRARRRAWLGILYIHDTCFPKNNTALICAQPMFTPRVCTSVLLII